MTTADWAIIISFGSLAISVASFIWNVLSKFIHPKPKVRVSFSTMAMFPSPPGSPSFLSLQATNHGPGDVTLHMAMARSRRGRLKRLEYGFLTPSISLSRLTDETGTPFAGGLPKKLAVGETFVAYFPYPSQFLDEPIVDIGFVDTFGKHHWAPRKKLRVQRRKQLEVTALPRFNAASN